MKEDLEKQIFEDFPQLFLKNGKRTLAWGFECGDGWFQIIYHLCETIDRYVKSNESLQDFRVLQVKEKFGDLRFYCENTDDRIRGMIDYAEGLSRKTCERTGKPGLLCVKNSWYKVLSPDEAEQTGYTIVTFGG